MFSYERNFAVRATDNGYAVKVHDREFCYESGVEMMAKVVELTLAFHLDVKHERRKAEENDSGTVSGWKLGTG